MLNIAIAIVLTALVAGMIYRAVDKYKTTDGSWWVKLKAAFESSESLFLSYFAAVGGGAISVSTVIADNLDQQWISQWITDHLSATSAGVGITVIGVVFFLARLRGFAAYFNAGK